MNLRFYESSEFDNCVERYRSPESGNIATIVFPLFSGFAASCKAAQTAAPEDMPASIPSSRLSLLAVSKASSFVTRIISSMIERFSILGINLAPMPCIR